jgi:hypothetical protein
MPSSARASIWISRTRPLLSTRELPEMKDTPTSEPMRRKGRAVLRRTPSSVMTAWLGTASRMPSKRTRTRRERCPVWRTTSLSIVWSPSSRSVNFTATPTPASDSGSTWVRATWPFSRRTPPAMGTSQTMGVPTANPMLASTKIPDGLRFSERARTVSRVAGACRRTSPWKWTRG